MELAGASAAREPRLKPGRRTGRASVRDPEPKKTTPDVKKARRRCRNEGFLRLVVEPWRACSPTGNFYDLTPFAESDRALTGKHRIALRNAYFKGVDRYVDVTTGRTDL